MKKNGNTQGETGSAKRQEGEFERSLKDYKGENSADLKPKKRKRDKNRKVINAVLISAIAASAAIFSVCAVLIVKNLMDKERGKAVYGEAAESFRLEDMMQPDASQTKDDEEPDPVYQGIEDKNGAVGEKKNGEDDHEFVFNVDNVRANVSWLKQNYSDVVGWIYVPDTTIYYPLMRSTNGDDDYYLTHAFNGEYLSVGSIYMVSDCDPVLTNNYNTLIYGHNVVNGAMFHDVMKFLDEEFFNTHDIMIFTYEGVYVYRPFSIYKTQSDYNYIQTSFGSEGEFLNFAAEMKSNSEIASGISVGEGDTMITLSTCTGTGVVSNARYSLHAKLVEFIDD